MLVLFNFKQETSKKSDKKHISLEISTNSFRQRKEWIWDSYSLDRVVKQGANSGRSVRYTVCKACYSKCGMNNTWTSGGEQVKKPGLLRCRISVSWKMSLLTAVLYMLEVLPRLGVGVSRTPLWNA